MGTLVLINGDDEFLKECAADDEVSVSLMERKRVFKFPEQIPEYEDYVDICSIGSQQEAVVVLNASDVPRINKDAFIIVVSSSGKTLSSKEAKRVIEVKKPKPYNDGAEYVRWILKEGEKLNIDLSRVASALFVNSGMDLRKIRSEIRKLKILSDSGDAMDPAVARDVMCFSAELTPKHVIDAICDGHPTKAIAFYDKLQERGDETGWIIAYMQRHVLQCLRAKVMQHAGRSFEEISASLGIQLSFFRNLVIPRLNLWSISSLQKSLDTLCKLDILHKRGVDVSRWGLEPEIIRLSEEAGHNDASHGR